MPIQRMLEIVSLIVIVPDNANFVRLVAGLVVMDGSHVLEDNWAWIRDGFADCQWWYGLWLLLSAICATSV